MRHEVMSGSQRGGNLYKLMANGDAVPNGIVNDVIAEAMVKSAAGCDVIIFLYKRFKNSSPVFHEPYKDLLWYSLEN